MYPPSWFKIPGNGEVVPSKALVHMIELLQNQVIVDAVVFSQKSYLAVSSCLMELGSTSISVGEWVYYVAL